MSLSGLTVAGLLLAAPAAAAPAGPLDGRWAPSNQCDRAVGDIDGATLIRGGALEAYEMHCDWSALKPGAEGVWSAPGACVLDGVKTPGALHFVRDPAGSLNITLSTAAKESVPITNALTLCPAR